MQQTTASGFIHQRKSFTSSVHGRNTTAKKLNRTQCRMKTAKERNIRLKELNAAVFLFFEKNRANLVTTWL